MTDNAVLTTYNKDTKVKYITSGTSGALNIEDSWGSLAKVLKQVLSVGFNPTVISSIDLDSVNNILQINFESFQNYSPSSVVSISGVSVLLDGEYRILDYGPKFIKVASDPDKSYVQPFNLTPSSIVKVAPLGFEILHDNIATTGKIMFKNKSVNSPGVLRVFDAKPANSGYLDTWSKFARITMGQNVVNIDKFLNDERAPFVSKYPDIENTGDKSTTGTNSITGYAKWYYALIETASPGEHQIPVSRIFPISWRIIGDDKTFYLFIRNQGEYSWYTIYSFGNYQSNLKEDTQNLILHAGFGTEIASWSDTSSYSSYRNKFTASNKYGACCIFKNSFRGLENEFLGYHFGLDAGDTSAAQRDYPSDSRFISSVSGNTGAKITSPVFIKDKNLEYRGQLRGISQIYGQAYRSLDGQMMEGSKIILSAQRFYNSGQSEPHVPYLFSLKDWE